VPEAREVPCPTCGTPRTTRLAGRQVLACPSCGGHFSARGELVRPGRMKAPAEPAGPGAQEPPAPSAAAPTPEPQEPSQEPRRARVVAKARRATKAAATVPVDRPDPRRRAQLAGARGGVAYYRTRVRRD